MHNNKYHDKKLLNPVSTLVTHKFRWNGFACKCTELQRVSTIISNQQSLRGSVNENLKKQKCEICKKRHMY